VGVTALLDAVSGRRAAAAPPVFARPKQPQLVAQVDDEDTRGKRNSTLASVSAQYSLHAAQADAVALGQRTVRGARPAVSQQVADDLLAEAVDESPPLTLRRKRRTLLLGLPYLDPGR
jgi:hypothetical protein